MKKKCYVGTLLLSLLTHEHHSIAIEWCNFFPFSLIVAAAARSTYYIKKVGNFFRTYQPINEINEVGPLPPLPIPPRGRPQPASLTITRSRRSRTPVPTRFNSFRRNLS